MAGANVDKLLSVLCSAYNPSVFVHWTLHQLLVSSSLPVPSPFTGGRRSVSSLQNQWLLLDFFIQAHPLEYHILFKLLTSWPHAQPRRARYLFWKYLDTTTLFLFGLKQANYDWGLSGGKKGLPGWSFQHLSAIPKFNHHLRCPSVLGGAGQHVNISGGKVGILRLVTSLLPKPGPAVEMWNFQKNLIHSFSICVLFDETMALKQLSTIVYVLFLLLSYFKADKKVKVHWKEWFNEKDDVGEVLLPAPATFLTNWLRFGVFLGQQQPAPCPSRPQWQCPQWVGFIM